MFGKPKRIEPKPGQESVWDYPRPPKLESSGRHITIEYNNEMIVDSKNSFRVLETSHPPTYYFPQDEIRMEFLVKAIGTTFCEWKGVASYYDLEVGEHRIQRAGWFYESPTEAFAPIKDFVSFYPGKTDQCVVDGEVIEAQEGDFYGGWITSDIVGPFKGAAGTNFW